MKMPKVLVMGASKYDFEDEQTGKKIKGCKIAILDPSEEQQDNVSGIMPKFITAPIEAFPNFDQAPAFYDIEFSVKLGSKKPVLTPVSFNFVQPFKVNVG